MCGVSPLERWRIRHFASHVDNHLVILFFKGNGIGVIWIHFQHTTHLRISLAQITLALRHSGKRKPRGSKTRNCLRGFYINAGTYLLRDHICILVKFGRAHKIPAPGRVLRIFEFLAQHDRVGLVFHCAADSHVCCVCLCSRVLHGGCQKKNQAE